MRRNERKDEHILGVTATAWNNDEVVMKGIKTHFDIIFDYLSFQNRGMVLAKGAGTVGMMPKRYYAEAYQLGQSI
ncbi:MAG: hypothetical protein K2N82_10370 [Lachnospiraceae bacterium]|nr:hypothetical protein [Lachnospiraceae bacterium]